MDFANAALLIATAFGLIELVKGLYPGYQALPKSWSSPITVVMAVVVSESTVFLVAATVWAHEQVVGAHPLDKLNVASKILVGLMLAGSAAFGDKVLGAVSNVGQNTVKKPITSSLGAGSSPTGPVPSSPDSPVAQ